MYSNSFLRLLPLRHPFCSLRNSLCLISKWLISFHFSTVSIFHIIGRQVMGLLLWVGGILFRGRIGSRWSFLWSSISKCLFLVSIYFDCESIVDGKEFFKRVSMYVIMAWCFPIWYFFESIYVYFQLRAFFESF